MNQAYVHGYDPRENQRLADQAVTLEELLHADTAYPEGHAVLEAGCGIGAQTIPLARRSPGAHITSIDISESSLARATASAREAGLRNVRFLRGDILDLEFEPSSFDHVFLCFVLEHLPRPAEALRRLQKVLKPGGTITAIEGDHGSTFFHPDCAFARRAIDCLVALQGRSGGNALIGRTLYPLLTQAGFHGVRVSPRMVYVDSSRPEWVEGFTKKTFAAMIEGVRGSVLSEGLMTKEDFELGVAGLYRAAEEDGVFCYTFFKASGVREDAPPRGGSGS